MNETFLGIFKHCGVGGNWTVHLSLIAQVSLDLSNVQTNVRKQFTHSAEMQIVSKHSSPEGCWCCSHFHPSMRIAIRDFWTQKVSELNMEIYLAKFNFFFTFQNIHGFLIEGWDFNGKDWEIEDSANRDSAIKESYIHGSVFFWLSKSKTQ